MAIVNRLKKPHTKLQTVNPLGQKGLTVLFLSPPPNSCPTETASVADRLGRLGLYKLKISYKLSPLSNFGYCN
jgi:hypothetical protein